MRSAPPLPPAVLAAIRRFQSGIEARFGGRLRELVLFGSFARGEAGDDSDVDLLVVVDELTEGERREVFDIAYDADSADREHWTGLAPVVYSTQLAEAMRGRERLLWRDIDAQGIRL